MIELVRDQMVTLEWNFDVTIREILLQSLEYLYLKSRSSISSIMIPGNLNS